LSSSVTSSPSVWGLFLDAFINAKEITSSSAGYEQMRRGWCIGSEPFRKELLLAAAERVGRNHYGVERRESGQEKADRLLRVALRELGWRETDLERRHKGDPAKVKIARGLRKETTMTLAWVAQRLQMGSWTYVANLLYEKPRQKECK